MKPENKKFLDDNRHHHDTLTKAFYLKGLNGNEREGMVRVMREEFQPGYTVDLWCPTCAADMVIHLYRYYDNWLSAQPKEEPTITIEYERGETELNIKSITVETEIPVFDPIPEESKPIEEPAPKSEPVANVKANFPKHKNHQRK